MKRQHSFGDGIDSGGEKSGSKEWGKRDQDGSKVRSLKNLNLEPSERINYRRSYSSKLEGGRSEDRDVRAERKNFSPEYRRKEHVDYRTDRKGFGRLDSPRKPFRDSVSERSHRSSTNGFSSPSSSSSFRRDFYDSPPKVKGFRSKRDDSTWRRSSSRERTEADARARSIPRSRSWCSRAVGARSVDKSSGASVSAIEPRKLENGENCSSEMEEGELEPEPEVEAAVTESPSKKEFEMTEAQGRNQDEEFSPYVSNEKDGEAIEGEKLEPFAEENESQLNVTAEVVEDHERRDAVADKPVEDKKQDHVNETGNESDGGIRRVDDEDKEELPKKEDVSSPSNNKDHLSKASFDSKRTDGSVNLLQDLNKQANDEGLELDEESMENDQRNNEIGNKCKQSATFMLEKPGVRLSADAGKVTEAEVGGSIGITQKAFAREDSETGKSKGKGLAIEVEEKLAVFDGLKEKDLSAFEDHRETPLGDSNDGRDVMEEMRMVGFQLFSETSLGNKSDSLGDYLEKHKNKKIKCEPLQLSLGLPDVSLTLVPQNLKPAAAPPSPSRAISEHSMPTNSFHAHAGSEGFTASISFSGSQPCLHNASCSLTQNSLEHNEHSVGSGSIFQAVDQLSQGCWQGQSLYEKMQSGHNGVMERARKTPLYQRLSQGSGDALQPLNYQEPSAFHLVNGNANFQDKIAALRGQRHVKPEESVERHTKFEGQTPFTRERFEIRRQEVAPSSTQNVGCHQTGFVHHREIDNDNSSLESKHHVLNRSEQDGTADPSSNGIKGAEKLIFDIVSEPVQAIVRRLHEMTDQSLLSLKEKVREMIVNGNVHEHLSSLQEVLEKRTDLTLETLLKCHRVQLEILVSVKTGLQAFLRQISHVPSSDLVEIFLNLKCKNLACRNILPVDDCDCKVCNQKNGFCSACMCLVCSRFDLASNTCSWVGCDVCLHWCHTDCGLRNSHIRNGPSVKGGLGTAEVQFHCVACGHASEMFGFVKEVFKICAKDWNAEALIKELGYVRRIFHGSADARGKQLHNLADQMLAHLESSGNVLDVYNVIMAFLSGDANAADLSSLTKHPQTSVIATLCKEPSFKASSTHCEGVPWPEVLSKLPVDVDKEKRGKQINKPELQLIADGKPAADELECIIRIKQAEAKMFQTRADDARREAEGLKHIAFAKSEKIEKEYASQIAKLHLADTEHRRRQKIEELQALERAHHDYFSMKVRMEADIKDLLLKMETTRQKLNM
ncbi:Protein OBERON 4 [Nymphaea thermarum]|nr:Protein OBERON 4 [Nymphaea thermarum]